MFLESLGRGLAEGGMSGLFSGLGALAKDLRTAITGQEPIDQTKAAELALKAQELVAKLEEARMSVMLAEASSRDPWTSRARPAFLYVMYVFLLAGLPMGVLSTFRPEVAVALAQGCGAWLAAIPEQMWWLFGAGYLGYSTVRTLDKRSGGGK